jgi:precorrin-3B C17-methyltransferase
MTGMLHMVSIGPGFTEQVAPAAKSAIEQSEVIVAYDLYLTWIRPWLEGKQIITYPLTEEKARATAAIEKAREGKRVSIISSGDIGVYGMASLVFEEMDESDKFQVCVVPGITAANACASILGAPLSHDYLVLSLSDLLCPWEWIEQRARQAAQADLCIAMYNVCSKKRPDGVYKILNLISEYKSDSTLCGVVKNAYREEQASTIATLGELKRTTFDMLTSIIIGNRFTRRKRNWLFTPRGYNNWQPADSALQTASSSDVPGGAVWVFSGTSDGNQLARELSDHGCEVVISAATEYGADLAGKTCPDAHIISGRTGEAARLNLMRCAQPVAVVDATHPYATVMSKQLMAISQDLQLPYIRFERPAIAQPKKGTLLFESFSDAFGAARKNSKRIFLACGSKALSEIDRDYAHKEHLYIRITPEVDSIRKAVEFGIPNANIIAMQGPFSKEMNVAMWRDLKIDVVVTKDSGTAGGFEAKVAAADELGIPLYVLKRPQLSYPAMASSYRDVASFLAGVKA